MSPGESYEELNLAQPESERDPFTEDRYRQFARRLPIGAALVLDIGCNTGRGGRVLKGDVPSLKLHGLDAVRQRVEQLPSAIYVSGMHGLSTAIPAGDLTYDAVVAGEFIEHIHQKDVDQTIGEVFRVLKIGGRLLLTTPNPLDIKRKVRGESILGGAHVSQHFHDALGLKLRMFGFSNVRVYGTGKVSRYVGTRFPIVLYGSYMIVADKF